MSREKDQATKSPSEQATESKRTDGPGRGHGATNPGETLKRTLALAFHYYPVHVTVQVICILTASILASLPSVFMQQAIAVVQEFVGTGDWATAQVQITRIVFSLIGCYVVALGANIAQTQLTAVICIEDPLRDEAREVIAKLKALGIGKVVMMTGDSERTARSVAAAVGVDDLHYEVLPEDKAAFIKEEHRLGRRVIMVGDGVNDSPALSESDAGIAISSGAAIAREIADITISAEDLYCLLTLKEISDGLMKRISANYRKIIGFNALLMLSGAAGTITPTVSAFLHNSSTLAIALASMRNYLPGESEKKNK